MLTCTQDTAISLFTRLTAYNTYMLTKLINDIEQNKIELDRLRSLVPKGLHNFEHCSDLELTYTSNAIPISEIPKLAL